MARQANRVEPVLHNRLAVLRAEHGLSRQELAAAIGVLDGEPRVEVTLRGGDGQAQRETTHFRGTFGRAPVGSLLLYVDSSGGLALADNQGNAAARLGLAVGDRVRITLA